MQEQCQEKVKFNRYMINKAIIEQRQAIIRRIISISLYFIIHQSNKLRQNKRFSKNLTNLIFIQLYLDIIPLVSEYLLLLRENNNGFEAIVLYIISLGNLSLCRKMLYLC